MTTTSFESLAMSIADYVHGKTKALDIIPSAIEEDEE